jgi:signal peptidase I
MRIEDDNYWHSDQRLPYLPDFDSEQMASDGNYHDGGGKSAFRDVVETILVTLLIFFMVRAVVQNFKVEGDSMLPTLHTDERLLVNSGLYYRYDANFVSRMFNASLPADWHYLFHGPQRGDIIVFESPIAPQDFIKRVIAVEGETVQIKADNDPVGKPDPNRDCGGCGVFVNGVKLDEPYINQTPNYDFPADGGVLTVPPGHIFVLGDNRRNSSDSHLWGPLDESAIIGTAFISYWPQDHWGLLPHPTYAEIKKQP